MPSKTNTPIADARSRLKERANDARIALAAMSEACSVASDGLHKEVPSLADLCDAFADLVTNVSAYSSAVSVAHALEAIGP